jgi:Txe/YoeB family toxin of Txe-Axe toxin-antitoxin module
MEIAFDEIAKEDLSYWKKSGNIAIQKKIESLLITILESPFKGIGKPEQLINMIFRDVVEEDKFRAQNYLSGYGS